MSNEPILVNPPRCISLDDLIKQQNHELRIVPMPLERDLLIKRVKAGGHSGQFLGDAFLSAYRTDRPFLHSLGEITKLDAEGIRLFCQIILIRHVRNWSDDDLFDIECDIKIIMNDSRMEPENESN